MTWTLQGLWPHVSPISPASLHPEKLDTLPSWDAARYLLFSPLHMLFSVARTPFHPFLTWSASVVLHSSA